MSLLARLREHALQHPQRCALAWSEGSLDYATLVIEVERFAARLSATGARCVALAADNGPAWAIADLAALSAGICLLPLPQFFAPTQVRHALRQSNADGLLSTRDIADPLPADQPRPHTWPVADSALLWRPLPDSGSTHPPLGVTKLTYTSGTTGEPKGVMLAWRHIRPVVKALADAVQPQAGDRHLALLPLAILLENIAGLYVPLWSGSSAVLTPLAEIGLRGSSRLDPSAMAAALTHWRATSALFLPQTLQALVEWLESGQPRPDALRFAAVGGAPVPARLLARAQALGLPVFEGYGLSECASVVCLNTPTAHRTGSVGRPLPHVQLKLSAQGEVLIAGAGFAGYLGQTDAAGAAGGWWVSGDLGRLDDDGYLFLHGRRRDIFITAFGRNVSPQWVEHELGLESAIERAAVFGEGRPWNSAVIVAAPGADHNAVDEALKRANATLPDYARVDDWLLAEQPFHPGNGQLTGTGRIRRDAIRQHYAAAIDRLYQPQPGRTPDQ